MKELLRYEGKSVAQTGSPREIIKASYAIYDFIGEQTWLSMLKARNDMTHIYDGEAAVKLVDSILNEYIPAFTKMKAEIEERYEDILEEL